MFFCVVIKFLKRKTKILLKKKGMFILLVIIIGFTFIIIFNLHRFKSSLLSLFIWPYFTKKWSLFSPFLFRSFSWYRPYFFCIFNGFFLLRVYVSYVGSCYYCENGYHCFSFFVCWLCRFVPLRSYSEFLLSWDFFSFLKLCVALLKPEEALFRYHSSSSWNILIDFFLVFLSVSLP